MDSRSGPFAVETGPWRGDDGNWGTFVFSVGSPPQSFDLLPYTLGSETWVPLPQGCEGVLANVTDCPELRGVDYFRGKPSPGFQTNESSTWETIGIYELSSIGNLFGTSDTGLYGLDDLGFKTSDGAVRLSSQTVAGVSTADVWLGSFGLGIAEAEFAVHPGVKSPLCTLEQDGIIPGISFGYTAGAYYSPGQIPGSLVLGGYDQARIKPSNISFPVKLEAQNQIQLVVTSIIAEGVKDGSMSLLPDGDAITVAIDTATAQNWLPQGVCDLFEQAFRLNYDNSTGLYLVDDTVHNELLSLNPSVTMMLTPRVGSKETTSIVLPYAAFDLSAGIPIYNYSTNYFPLRVAANKSQQVLGRAFMQEAYLVVDYERGNFTIGQAIHQNHTSNIVEISLYNNVSSTNQGSGLSKATIASIVIGILLALSLPCGLAFYRQRLRRVCFRKKRPNSFEPEKNAVELPPNQIYELHEDSIIHEISAYPEAELEGSTVIVEADSKEVQRHQQSRIVMLGPL